MNHCNKENDRNSQNNDPIRKLIRIKSVLELTGLSKSYIYDLANRDLFPKSIQLVPGGTSVAWVAAEVQGWIELRIQARDDQS